MLVDQKIFGKLEKIEHRYSDLRYRKVADIPMEIWETREHFTHEPSEADHAKWRPVAPGTRWGDNWVSAWFRGDLSLPEECYGRKVLIRARTGGETLLFIDGRSRGVFDDNHPVVMMALEGNAGHRYHLAFEAYAGHYIPGCAPDDNNASPQPGCKTFDGVELVLEREDVGAFVFDLRVIRQIAAALDENSLRRNRIQRELAKVFAVVDAMPAETPEESWRPKLAQARAIMRPLLEAKNGSTTPWFGIIGHSHLDTAWLWPITETWRKSARTFSSVLNLMEQYPGFKFIQSAPYHAVTVRERYPELFERIAQRVREGRWEPNGAMWVEPDCNLPSGESLVRQLLIGQQTTRELFGYTADTLWLPDVFGYSAALPQILRGAGVEFFCTTKLSWNDTTRFPYDTFIWKGIDGSAVWAHFNAVHCWPEPEALWNQWRRVQHKDVQDRALCAFGFGDGGGGPMAEMLEVATRLRDLEGCPKVRHTSVSEFMKGIRDELSDLPEWSGELYLELHRGTLTSIAPVKRGNRKTEIALRDAEFLCTLAALCGAPYPSDPLRAVWKNLLTHQFHDILPGSSIGPVNDEAVTALDQCIREARALSGQAFERLADSNTGREDGLLVVNTLSWERSGEITLRDLPEDFGLEAYPNDPAVFSQRVTDLTGRMSLVISGLTIPALGGSFIPLRRGSCTGQSPFKVGESDLETPHAMVRFDDAGRIVSFLDKGSGRELVRPNGALNTFWLGEDIPEAWDSWDIDRDQSLKMQAEKRLISREVVSDGPLQLRLRSYYQVGEASRLTQDMVFHAGTSRVDFETVVDWAEKHKLLKVGFELNLLADTARHEIQYGHVERPTHTNLPQDRARFEVCAHKWTDLSENGFGVALLNDCKYGVGVHGSELRLSLIKSGLRPDSRGDEGRHRFSYALLPHQGGFSVESVVRAAYEFNIPPLAVPSGPQVNAIPSLVTVDAANVIIESVKWAEQGSAFVIRLYEAGKTGVTVRLGLSPQVDAVYETNLLEEDQRPLEISEHTVRLTLRPFEIKTLWCEIGERHEA